MLLIFINDKVHVNDNVHVAKTHTNYYFILIGEYLSQIDSILTQIFSNYSESRVKF